MQISCHEGVGPIRFGMSPHGVRAILGTEFTSFRRSPDSVHPCDHFGELEYFVYYDDAKCLVEAIEFAAPAAPRLDGLDLLGLGFADLIVFIRQADPNVSVESDGFISLWLGIGGWAPSAQERPDDPAESIIVFAPGYYD